jgi:hypothetical protein
VKAVSSVPSVWPTAVRLTIYQFQSAAQSGGSGMHDRMSLMMRRSPRVNHEVLLRATFLG